MLIKRKKLLWVSALYLLLCVCGNAQAKSSATPVSTVFNHVLKVSVEPATGTLSVKDMLSTNIDEKRLHFGLSSVFKVQVDGQPLKPIGRQGPLSLYEVPLSSSGQHVALEYKGKVDSTDQCDWLKQSCRLLNERGVYLDTGSFWYPIASGALHKFSMEIDLPDGWVSLGQGESTAKDHWQEQHPQDDIYLLAGPFEVYQSEQNNRKAMVYLQRPDEALANTYLQATHRYLDQYSTQIGDYPYSKFATVESFWETGWGMPSFTLLGPQVIRLPFIPHTSLPHEILHNWWGNSVYIDTEYGNWAEGLTAYMADHQSRVRRGSDRGYRRDTLQKYALFAQGERDFPLKEFRSRHDNATQAVGYGKSMMLFHQLRKKLGNEVFNKGLSLFYQDHRFTGANFQDIRDSFEKASGADLSQYFRQWLNRSGAPKLSLMTVSQTNTDELEIGLEQMQSGKAFTIDVPVRVHYASGEVSEQTIKMSKARQDFTLPVKERVLKVSVDPEFDLLRFPDPAELPVTLNSRYGDGEVVVFNQQSGTPAFDVLAKQLAASLSRSGSRVKTTGKIGDIPRKGTLIVIQPSEETLAILTKRLSQELPVQASTLTLPQGKLDRDKYSSAMVIAMGGLDIVLLDAPSAESLKVLMRKMPHYGKYSYIAFDSTTGKNISKGQWEVSHSPLIREVR